MFVRQVADPKLAQFAYLIGCPRTGEAIVIHPERDVDRYFDLAASHKLRLDAAADTHIHADYLSGYRRIFHARDTGQIRSNDGLAPAFWDDRDARARETAHGQRRESAGRSQ